MWGGLKTHHLNEFAPLTPDKLGPLICKRINHLPYFHVHTCTQPHPPLLRTHTVTHVKAFYVTYFNMTQLSGSPCDTVWSLTVCAAWCTEGCFYLIPVNQIDVLFYDSPKSHTFDQFVSDWRIIHYRLCRILFNFFVLYIPAIFC